MAGFQRDEAEAGRSFLKPETSRSAQFGQIAKQRLLLSLRVFVQLGFGVEVFLALEGAGNIAT